MFEELMSIIILTSIIMTSNRKSVVNDNSVVQSLWFTVPFVRGIIEKFGRLNRLIIWEYRFIISINCEN